MPVTKRLRYEVLRRDNHTCRYCGATAPDVKLTIDHVIPQALGGPDEPANLVAACEPCNSGKSSIPADSPIVSNVAEDALRWSQAMKTAAETAHADYQARAAYRELFRAAWTQWSTGSGENKQPIQLDDNWQNSLDNFREAGLPDWELEEAVRAAMSAKKVTPENTFRYFCGICWGKIRKMQEHAQRLLQPRGEAPTEGHQHVNELASCTEWVALHIWMGAWCEQHGKVPDDDAVAAFCETLDEGFIREHLKTDQWKSVYEVLTAAYEAGRVKSVTPQRFAIPYASSIDSEQADPLRFADKIYRASWDTYMSLCYLSDTGIADGRRRSAVTMEEIDWLELGDELANTLQCLSILLSEQEGVPELEQRFRQGRSWSKAAEAVKQAFELMASEQSPLMKVDGTMDGLLLSEIAGVLEQEEQR